MPYKYIDKSNGTNTQINTGEDILISTLKSNLEVLKRHIEHTKIVIEECTGLIEELTELNRL